MVRTRNNHKLPALNNGRSFPPGRVKIVEALRKLLRTKDFSDITTVEIAKTAGVTEALIYKYFKDKRDLLYQILAEYLQHYLVQAEIDLKGIKGSLNKLRKSIWTHINTYATDRVFAKVLLLEVRSYSDYYTSEPYKLVKKYSNILYQILQEGIERGEIRTDLSPEFLRQAILGSIEHVCLTGVAFNREISPDELTEKLCQFLFHGLMGGRAGP
ncbi:MAG: TetR/AcrR family transcriptional regulator [Thermodesulfobacteriota bacterium]